MYFTNGAALQAAIDALPSSKKGTFLPFDATYYKTQYMGSYTGTLSPLEHFVQVGAALGNQPNAVFNPAYYESQYADLQGKGYNAADLLIHFLRFGLDEGRVANPTLAAFDGEGYLLANPDVLAYVTANLAQFGGSLTNGAIAHFIKFGAQEGRDPSYISNGVYTLTEVVKEGQAGTPPVTAVYWGYNPNSTENDNSTEGPLDGGVPVAELVKFLTTITGLDLAELGLVDDDGVGPFDNVTNLTISNALTSTTGDSSGPGNSPTLTITYADGTSKNAEVELGAGYMAFLNDLLFDSEGNSRLYEKVIVEGTEGSSDSLVPIRLTPSENNGGTVELGRPTTTAGDDIIVAGRLELLHRAYIDGGAGYNILEVDAKGEFAQPLELLNIQEVRVENLPNFYTNDDGTLVDGDPAHGYLDNSSYPYLGDDRGSRDSFLDLSRATSIQKLVVTEGNAGGYSDIPGSDLGDLTIVGVRNGATLRLEGGFTQDVTVHYGQGQTGPLTVELLLGQVAADLNFVHNNDSLHLVSLGGSANSFGSEDIGGRLTNLKISGDAALYINGDLDSSFQDETPITIDASENTGGVNLELSDSQNVTFVGSQGNDIFKVDTQEDGWFDGYNDNYNNSSVAIMGGSGDNLYAIDNAYRLDIASSGNGNNDIEVDWTIIANIQVGNGNNHVQIDDAQNVTLVAGNGNNHVEVYAWEEEDTAYPDYSLDVPVEVNITAGNGKNVIDVEVNDQIGVANITVGDGGNDIDVYGANVSITSGTGTDVMKVLANTIVINSGGGGDTVTIGGMDYDYVGTDELGGNASDGERDADWGDDGALVQINLGSGNSTVILGSAADYQWNSDNEFPGMSSLTAHEGSFITGANVTLFVNTVADLRAATLTGVTSVVIDDDAFDMDDAPNANVAVGGVNAAVLTLTASQFMAIGADNFRVDGAIFNTHGFVKIIVDSSTSLTALGVGDLPRNIDLLLEVQDGVTLTMTAEQLHTRVAQNGVTLVNDGNTDTANGKVVITGGGINFDPFNTSDTVQSVIDGQVYYGGSLSNDFKVEGNWYNVQVKSTVNGYDRPADAAVEVVLTLDSTGTTPLVQGAFESWHQNLEIIGDQDITFTGAVGLGEPLGVPTNPFDIDFSALEGVVTNFTVDNFELLGQGGSITGNAGNGYASEVHISIAADEGVPGTAVANAANNSVGFDEANAGSLVSSGVTRYVVTTIDGPTAAGSLGNQATIKLCDTAQDIEVFALRGNYNDTLNIVDAAWGLAFELQGGGTAKAEGPTGTANVGKLVANYEWNGADAVVNLVHSVAGDTRTIKAYGITIDNADSITLNAAGNATIDVIAGNSLNELMLNGSGNVAVTAVLPTLDVIDASGVTGTFAASIDQVDGSASTDFVFTGAQGGSTLSLIDSFTATSATTIDGGAGGMTLVVVGDETVDLDAASLSGIEAVVLNAGSTIVLTVAQAVAIGEANFSTPGAATASVELSGLNGEPFVVPDFADDITITLVSIKADPVVTLHADTNLTGIGALVVPGGTTLNLTAAQYQQLTDEGTITILAGTTGPVTVNITDLSTADLAGGFDVSDVADAITLNLQVVGNIDLSAADLTGVDAITFGDDATLTLGDIQQGNGVAIVGGSNSTLVFKDTGTMLFEDTDASGFDVTYLKHTNTLTAGGNRNIDDIFTGLAQTITKVVYNGEGWVNAVDQTVIIEAGTTVLDSLVYNKVEADVELQDFTINLMGGVELSGNLRLSTGDKFADADGDGNQDAGENYLIRDYLQTLTINSTGTAANLLTGVAANIIDGDVTPMGINGSLNNNLLAVAINATQALTITGKLVFNSNVGNDNGGDGMTVNDVEDAVATLTVTGTADVNVGTIDTSDADVDGLNVVNEGSGTITATINSANVQNADVLSFTATGTGDVQLNVVGTVDLSGDVLTAVSQITIADGATLTLSQAQFDALGAANIIDGGVDGSAILNLNGVNAAFDATTIDANIDVQTLTLAGSMDFAATASNLTGVDQIVVPEGATLTLTAAQFQQLKNAGTIVGAGAPATTSYTVNITGLTQADIDGGAFDTSGITAGTITLSLAADVNLSADDVIENVDSVILADGQTLGLANATQADDLNVNGGANTTIVFQFTPHATYPGQINAAGYSVTTLKALANGFTIGGNSNVEYSIDDLPSAVILRLYADPADLGFLDPTFRVVVIEEGITTPTGLIFNDWDDTDEVRSLTLTLEGGVELNGNLSIPTRTDKDGDLIQQYFSLLTINSEGAQANVIDGNINTATVLGAPNTSNNNLLNVVINATQDLVVDGDIVFNSIDVVDDDAVASLVVTGAGNVSVEQLNVLDDDIDVLSVANNGTGTLTVTGASPAIDGDASIETINLSGTGDIVFGVHPDVGVVTEWGISAAGLSTLNASALTGDLTLGEVRDVDSANFTFTAGSGVTKLTMSADTLNATQVTDTGWTFNFTNAAAGSEFHLGSLTQTSPVFTDGPLTINLGANTTLYIDKNTDLTGIDLTLLQTLDIVLADNVTLTLTAAQANGLNIVAGADTGAAGFDGVVNVTQLGTAAYDLSGISADIAGTVTLAGNDVTLNAATDLGDFSVTLETLGDETTTMAGQTIRFQNVAQAEREIIAANDATPLTGSSTNVVWLFNSVAVPVNTDDYASNLGRLWISQTLANGANIEDLFTSLPATIVRVEFSSLEFVDAMLTSVDVNRVVELVAHTNLAAGLTFSDGDRLEHLNTLTLQMGGSVNVGELNLDNIVVPAANVGGITFDKLTINSERALHQDHYLAPELYINDNDGVNEEGEHVAPANLNVIGNVSIGGNNGLDLLNVELNTGALSTVGAGLAGSKGANLQVGTITFDSEVAASTATLTVTGANTTTIASLNTADADITGLTITNSGSGTLTVTGASPAAAVSNTETLTINATGDVVLGTAGDATKPGVSGADLSLIDVNGSGTVDLGVIALVDGNDFTLDTEDSTGDVTAVLDGATLNAAGEWTIEGSWTVGTLNVTLKDTVTLGAGTLTIDDAVITISGNVNLTTLADLDIVDLSDVTFIVPAGNSLTILAEDADGLTVTGGGLVTITELEATPDADFANVMTTDGDTGTVEVLVTTDVLTPVNFTGDMGKAHVTVSGNGVFDVTGASNLNSVVFDHDDSVGTAEVSVMSSYTVGAAATLVLTAAQGDDRTVNGAGTTNVEDIGAYAGGADMSLAGVASATVNIAVDTSVTLDSADNLGAAGAGRVTTIAEGVTLTSAGSVVNGQYIVGEDATLLVDDENTVPTETPITANLSNVTVEFITLVDTAIAGMITFPALYGSPAAKDLDPLVAVQTVEMTAAQASGQTINGAGAGTQGEVIVNALGADFTNLSLIDVGRATAYVPADATLHAGTTLGEFAVVLDGVDVDLVLTAAQADGRSITDAGADGDSVTVTALELTPNADLSAIDVETETALLDANGGVTLGANLGANMEVIVSDSMAGGSNVVTFTGQMVSADTTFTIAADDIELVFDANDAHQLTVAEAVEGVPVDQLNSAVTVNNVDGDEMDLSGITADTLVANVPADAVMHANTDFGGFVVRLAEGADITMTYDQFLDVAGDGALAAGDFDSAAGGVEEIITVTNWTPASGPLNTALVLPNLALKLVVEDTDTNVVVDAGTDLSGVEEIEIPDGTSLTMTADQFQQIQTSLTVTGAGTLHITGLDQDNFDIDLSTVTANAGTISLDATKGATQIVAGQVQWVNVADKIVLDPAAVLDNASGAQFGIIMTADNQGITLSSETQADGRSVTENGALADTRLILGFDSPDATDGNVNLNAANYEMDDVIVLNTYLSNQFGGVTPANIETFLAGLDSSIPVTIFDADAALVANVVAPSAVASVNRVVTVEPNTRVDASIAFNDIRPESEVVTLVLNLGGNSVIDGNLTLPQNEDPRGQLPTSYVQLFQSLTINSTDEVGSLVSPNVLNGNIIANTGLNGAESQVEVFTLTLDAAMAIAGSEDQIGFDGEVINLGDGWTEVQVGVALAAGSYNNWRATFDGVNVVTFTNITAGATADAAIGSFTFLQNGGSSANFPGTSAVAVTQQGSFAAGENNLLNVTINAEHDLNITGEIEFSYVSGTESILNNIVDETAEANLTIDVDAGVTVNIGSVDTSDDHITALNFVKTGTGTVNAPGTSPGASVGDTETLNITQVNGGEITFGTAGDLAKPGVAGDDLSLIDLNGQGTINLGVIALVDGNDFTLNTDDMLAGSVVNATLRADMAAGGTWTLDNSAGPGDVNVTIAGTGVADTYGVDPVYGAAFGAGGTLVVDNVDLIIEGEVDFTNLTLNLTNTTLVVPAGATLTLTVDQVLAFQVDGIAVTGEGTVEVVGNADDANSVLLGMPLQTVNVDLSGVTLTIADGVSALAGDEVFEFDNAGAIGDDGVTVMAQNLIGSANNDLFTLSNNNDTVTGGAGDDTYTGGTGYYTYNVDAGTDTITELFSDGSGADVLVVSAGATANATVLDDFVATADSSNAGTVVVVDGDDLVNTTIDFTLAGGTGSYTITGGNSAVTGTDRLAGGGGDDIINGGNTTQTTALAQDILTGNGGADRFNFNLTLSSAATLTVATTQGAIDREIVTFTADDTDDGTESITINYTVNGIAGVALVDLTTVNVLDLTAITAAAIAALDAKAGIAATAGVNPGEVVISGDNGASLTITGITVEDGLAEDGGGEPVVGGLSAVASNGTDQAQISTITVAGTPTVGDYYSVVVDYNEGTGTTDDYTALGGDTSGNVADGLDDLLSEAVVSAVAAGSVVTLTAVDADDGGFSVLTDTTAAFAGSGASDNGAVDYLTADIITDFTTTEDTISFGLAAGVNGVNYLEAAGVATYTDARNAANAAFDGTVQYYLTSAADLDGGATTGLLATGEEGAGLLFFDANLDGNVDGVVVLLGVTNTSFNALDIAA